MCHCEVTDVKNLWESMWQVLFEDMQYKRRRILNFPTLQLTGEQKKAFALLEVEKLMWQTGRSMKDYPQIEMPDSDLLGEIRNRLINEEMNYDRDSQREEQEKIYNNLNDYKKIAFNAIMESVDSKQGKLIFVEGQGGTGKTCLWKAITTKIISEGKIVLAVALCGITALLLEGGRTAHSRFHIPLNISDESTCDIKQGTYLAALLNNTSLILWDEDPMAHRNCFEALDKSLRNILRCTNENNDKILFGGMTIVLGGDFT
jgi:hypothetical protein